MPQHTLLFLQAANDNQLQKNFYTNGLVGYSIVVDDFINGAGRFRITEINLGTEKRGAVNSTCAVLPKRYVCSKGKEWRKEEDDYDDNDDEDNGEDSRCRAKPIGNNGQLSLSNAATLADATLSSNNVGRIMAFKGLFAVQWRDVRSMQFVAQRDLILQDNVKHECLPSGGTRKLDWKCKSSKKSREETNGRETHRNVNECVDQLCTPLAWRRQ
ncbi:PREDICTED: uncharacterized protein LOC105559004 [Vollenhovia emeryi]|uniref:uncharacterized protein LOC105559004 n=1 Tax=Vollenhovia emeryi TaxID=411798 RepID=UPI0005F44955|nr:PREDICTED: uncharacterized protein LOC105559004 [Vollenhovia emeryi]